MKRYWTLWLKKEDGTWYPYFVSTLDKVREEREKFGNRETKIYCGRALRPEKLV